MHQTSSSIAPIYPAPTVINNYYQGDTFLGDIYGGNNGGRNNSIGAYSIDCKLIVLILSGIQFLRVRRQTFVCASARLDSVVSVLNVSERALVFSISTSMFVDSLPLFSLLYYRSYEDIVQKVYG